MSQRSCVESFLCRGSPDDQGDETSETTESAMAQEPEDSGRTAFGADFFEHPAPTIPEERPSR